MTGARQLTIDGQLARIDRTALPVEDRWRAFVSENPHAQPEIVATCRQLHDQGVARVTIAVVWEELRTRVRTNGHPYRWDNSLRAPAAAWLRLMHPDLAVHMRTRRSSRG